MEIKKQPFGRELKIIFSSETEYHAFMNVLRLGKEEFETGNHTYDEEFHPVMKNFVSKLEGTLIYPR